MQLRAALAADGRDVGALGVGGGGRGGDPHWEVVQALQGENSGLELENTRLKIQLVGVDGEEGRWWEAAAVSVCLWEVNCALCNKARVGHSVCILGRRGAT